MKPIEKTSDDLFQKLRSRFSPISMGDETANETSEPSEARIFNFMYRDGDNDIGYISISIIDKRSFKVYYGTDLIEKVENKTSWYNFLKELRMFAKRNLMSFDARDLAKNQLEPRDFKFISQQDGTYKEHEVTVSESVMFGSRRKSYQTMENVKMIVNHRKSIDETIPGARSRYIESIYLERADGERYKFPYTYLTGARAMARHINEGGNPYDDMGKHIIGMIGEMRHLSKFARRTKKHAMEDENAGSIRNSVVERFHNMKKQLGAMSVKEGYTRFVENFKADEALVEDDAVQQIKERFTQQVFDTQLEDTLPAVMKALKEAEMKQLAEKTMDKSIASLIKGPLVLRKDDAADQMFLNTKFTDGVGLLGFILSDIASRAIGDNADEIANFASDAAERIQDKDYDQNDKQTAMRLAKKYMDDVRKSLSDPSFKNSVRMDPKMVYGKMKKREGGFHESETFEAWANDLVPENSFTNEASNSDLKSDINHYISLINDADEYSFYGSDEEAEAIEAEAEQLLNQIRAKYGENAANHAMRAASSYGTNRRMKVSPDSLSGGIGAGLNKTPTKSGKLNKNTQKAMKNPMNNLGRKVGGPKGTLPEDYDPKAAKDKRDHDHAEKNFRQGTKDDPINASWYNRNADAFKDASKNAQHKAVTGMDAPVKKKSNEAVTQGTAGTQGTTGPAALAQTLRDPKVQGAAKLAATVAQRAGVPGINAPKVAATLGKQETNVPLGKKDMEPVAALGAMALKAATNKTTANQLASVLGKANKSI